MLKHLTDRSKYKLIPYGADFIEESIEQARREILPNYASNFIVSNVKDFIAQMKIHSYDFIFFDPYHFHPSDLPECVDKRVDHPEVSVGLWLCI